MNDTSEDLQQLLKINFLLVGIVLISMIVFFLGHQWIEKLLLWIKSKIGMKIVFDKVISLWNDLGIIRPKMFKAVLTSVIIQFIGVLVFWLLISPFVEEKLDFIHALCFIPMGFMTLALPIAPSGLGVGHAIFQKIFDMNGISNGASLFNLYFVLALAVNVFGVIPYILGNKKEERTKVNA